MTEGKDLRTRVKADRIEQRLTPLSHQRVEISGNAKDLSRMPNSSHHIDYETRERRRKASMFLNDPELLITHAESTGMVRYSPAPSFSHSHSACNPLSPSTPYLSAYLVPIDTD